MGGQASVAPRRACRRGWLGAVRADAVRNVRARAVEGRGDLSRFVIHLTRDDRADGDEHVRGQSAQANFRGIIDGRQVMALRPHCLHGDRIPAAHRERFSVCCFTEVPLSELHRLTRRIEGRGIQFSDYGIVFSREFLTEKGAQPAIYINSYDGNTWLREAADEIYDVAAASGFEDGACWRLLPYLNGMHEGYDFAWEREWRVAGNLEFQAEDVVCVVLPETGEEELTRAFLKRGVPVVSPGWSADRIVAEFSRQARRAKELWAAAGATRGRGKLRGGKTG